MRLSKVLMFPEESERCGKSPEVWMSIHTFPVFSLGKRIHYVIYSLVRIKSLES